MENFIQMSNQNTIAVESANTGFSSRGRGTLVALLGPDGAGKSTLAQSLVDDERVRARLIYMGSNVYASTVGLPTSRWLHEKKKALSHSSNRIGGKLLGVLSFGDRLASHVMRCVVVRYHRLCGRVVILDRHVYDSWVAKAPSTFGKRFRKRLFEAGFPAPDLVVLLDAPGELLLKRKGEHTAEWLESQRLAYLALKDRIPQMVVVDATQSLEAVQREVTSLVFNHRDIRTKGPVRCQ